MVYRIAAEGTPITTADSRRVQSVTASATSIAAGESFVIKAVYDATERHGLCVEHSDKYGWSHTSPSDDLLEFVMANNLTDILLNRNEYSGFRIVGTGAHSGTNGETPPRTSSTRKYACPCCGNSVRATKVVNIACLDCGQQMIEV